MTRIPTTRRSGLTLVELLVVISLIILLAALTVAVTQSSAFSSQKVVSGGDRASGWLMMSRQRAMRDGLPRGVRFLLNPVQDPALNPTGDPTYYASTEAQYIEAPEPWVPNPDPGTNPNGPRIAFVYYTDTNSQVPNNSTYRQVYFVGSAADLNEFDQRVIVGDYILFPNLKRVCKIANINNTTANVGIGGLPFPARLLYLLDNAYPDLGANNSGALPSTIPPAPPSCLIENQFAFQPAPRPLIGEPTLQLTGGTVIDCRIMTAPSLSLAPVTTTFGVTPNVDFNGKYYFDVLFSPSGNVMQTTGSLICLWVRDPEKTPHPRVDVNLGIPTGVDLRPQYDAAGEQVLVTVYTQTGQVATHPPAPPPFAGGATPYDYAKDGMNSGL